MAPGGFVDVSPGASDSRPSASSLMVERIHRYFPNPEYVVLTEVADRTGMAYNRADAIVMSTYPSAGLYLHGIEIKITRNDWLRELRQPAKADQIRRYCDYWWLVTPVADIVKPGELPAGWGHLIISKSSRALRAKVKAPRLSPLPMDRRFLAALLRNAADIKNFQPPRTVI